MLIAASWLAGRSADESDVDEIQNRTLTEITRDAAAKCAQAIHKTDKLQPYYSAMEQWNAQWNFVRNDPRGALREARWLTLRLVDGLCEGQERTETYLDLLTRVLYGKQTLPKQVLVHTLNGPTRVISVRRSYTVADLKRVLSETDGIPVEAQRLEYRGLDLTQSDSKPLLEAVDDNALLELRLRRALCGGVKFRVDGGEVVDISSADTVAEMVRKIRSTGADQASQVEFVDVGDVPVHPYDESSAASADSSPEELLMLLCQCVNSGRAEALRAKAGDVLDDMSLVIDPNFGKYHGLEQCCDYYATIGAALGGVRLTLAHVERNSGGDVRVCFNLAGSHEKELFGIPARGRPIEIQGIALFSFTRERKIKCAEYNWNAMGLMQQLLGAHPAPLPRTASPTPSPHSPRLQGSGASRGPSSDSAPESSDTDTNSQGLGGGEATTEGDLMQLVSDDFDVDSLDLSGSEEPNQGESLAPADTVVVSKRPSRAVKPEPGAFEEQPEPFDDLEAPRRMELAEQEQALDSLGAQYEAVYDSKDMAVASRRGDFGQEGPKHGSKVCLRFLEYQCGYCGERKISTSAGGDGRVRIRCDCGGKHQDRVPRMHAKWKMCTDTPMVEEPEDFHMPVQALVGGRLFNGAPKRTALGAVGRPY